jgi:hypothetical protein
VDKLHHIQIPVAKGLEQPRLPDKPPGMVMLRLVKKT